MRYEFGEFTLRPADYRDLAQARAWVDKDQDHRTTTPFFWISQSETTNCFLLLGVKGPRGTVEELAPVFFFRIDERPEAQVEIHIQFSGPQALRERLTRRGVMEGFAWLEKMLRESGFQGYYFHSINPQLIFFCQHRLGFEWDGTRLYRDFGKGKNDGQAEREEAQCAAQQ